MQQATISDGWAGGDGLDAHDWRDDGEVLHAFSRLGPAELGKQSIWAIVIASRWRTKSGEADAVYIQLREGPIDDTIEASPNVFVDVDDAGVPVGVELLFARRYLKSPDLSSITVNLMPIEAS